jgi:hypothetical protein
MSERTEMGWEIVATDAATGVEQWRATAREVLEVNGDDEDVCAGVAALNANPTVSFFIPTHGGAIYLERAHRGL